MNLKQHAQDSHTNYSIPSLDRILQKVLEMNRAIEYEKPVLMANPLFHYILIIILGIGIM